MEHNDHAFASLFSISQDCVIGVRSGIISFMNSAAASEFGDCVAMDAKAIIPEHMLDVKGDFFTGALEIRGRIFSISSSKIESIRLYLLKIQEQRAEDVTDMNSHLAIMRETLASMRLAIERMQRGQNVIDENGAELQSIDVLKHSYYRLSRLAMNTGNLIDLEHGTYSLRYSRLDLVELCHDMVSTVSYFTRSRGINLTFGCRQSSMDSVVDRDLIEKMLLHLLLNSMLHMDNGGNIRVGLAKLGDSAVISVDDDGDGIEPELLPELFISGDKSSLDPKNGLGIGLRICRRIVEEHNGSIVIESRPGEGTSVRAMLGLDNSESVIFKSAEVDYRVDGMEMVLTQLSIWLDSSDYGQKFSD